MERARTLKMKVIIAGCRDFNDYNFLKREIDKMNLPITEIVSGGARGVDTLGEKYANELEIPIKRFPANWDLYGKSAGPIRNKEMAKYGNYLIAFWDGKSRGTKNMIDRMKELGKDFAIVNI